MGGCQGKRKQSDFAKFRLFENVANIVWISIEKHSVEHCRRQTFKQTNYDGVRCSTDEIKENVNTLSELNLTATMGKVHRK